jgi:hypothetical protein
MVRHMNCRIAECCRLGKAFVQTAGQLRRTTAETVNVSGHSFDLGSKLKLTILIETVDPQRRNELGRCSIGGFVSKEADVEKIGARNAGLACQALSTES